MEGVRVDRPKPLILVNGQLGPNVAPPPALPPAPRGAAKRKRREREHYSPEPFGSAKVRAGGSPKRVRSCSFCPEMPAP
jgi:hypothetical protein